MNFKKFVALILAICMIFTMSVSTAFASNHVKEAIIAGKVLCGTGLLGKTLGALGGTALIGDLFAKGSGCQILDLSKLASLPECDLSKLTALTLPKFEIPQISIPAISGMPSISDIIANVKKGLDGTGLVYDRDYKIECEGTIDAGYRIHIIQPTTGKTLYDNWLHIKDGKWTWDKSWGLPELPTELSLPIILANVKQALDDSGVRFISDKDITITRTSADGFKILLVNPFNGKTILDKSFVVEDEKTITINCDLDSTAGVIGGLIDPNFPDDPTEEDLKPVEEAPDDTIVDPVIEEEVPVVETLLDDVTPLGETPVVGTTELPNTGDATFAVMGAVAVLAGAAFVTTKKIK